MLRAIYSSDPPWLRPPDVYVTWRRIPWFERPTDLSKSRIRARRLLGTCDRHEAESAPGGRSHSHYQHSSPGDTRATLDERQGHVSALLHLSAPVFGAIGHLRRGGKQGLVKTLTATAPPSSPRVSALPIYRSKDQTLAFPMVPHRALRWPNTDRTYAI